MIKARAYKGAGQKWSLNVTFHASGSLRVWENVRIEPSHSQVNSHFESWGLDGPPNLHKAIVGVKTNWIEKFIISLEIS
jgi:hypothetical protein